MRDIILASASPRRKELLSSLGYTYKIICAHIDEEEIQNKFSTPEDIVRSLAFHKARAVFLNNQENLVIGADTVVVHQGKILGKPDSKEEAFEMLKSLSGKAHLVYTGVALLSKEKEEVFFCKTTVNFKELTDSEINTYIESGSPFDKAGSYGIQDSGFVQSIEGSYNNVVGLPTESLKEALERF